MSFVLIVESEKDNAERIRAILDAADRNFEYQLVNSPETAIDIVENKTVDVLISAMEMPVMSGKELFSMIQMLSPDTVRVAMTDASRMTDTVALMNECKTFKIIIKPCRVAEDLIAPIDSSIDYKMMCERSRHEEKIVSMGVEVLKKNFSKKEDTWKRTLDTYDRIRNVLSQMLCENAKLGDLEEQSAAKLSEWYDWMLDTYIKDMVTSLDDFQISKQKLLEEYHNPEQGQKLLIAERECEQIGPEQGNEIIFILHIIAEISRIVINKYTLKAAIEETEKAYILRVSGMHSSNNENVEGFSNMEDKTLKLLHKAAEMGISALGNKSVSIEKGEEKIVNIAIRK